MKRTHIIFIHKGDSWYLSYALKQAKHSNPNANIVLLGDHANEKYKRLIKHEYISDFSTKAERFATLYKHFSTTDYHHELFCIQRWFVWLEYMETKKIENGVLPDTDVLIFQDVNIYYDKIQEPYIFTKGCTGYMGFVKIEKSNLDLICKFISMYYSSFAHINELENDYNEWIEKHKIGGVSDITLFEKYEKLSPIRAFNFETPPLEDKAFINSLESPFYLKNRDNYIDIIWEQGVPYATLLDGTQVSIMGIHCFGFTKKIYTVNSIKDRINGLAD